MMIDYAGSLLLLKFLPATNQCNTCKNLEPKQGIARASILYCSYIIPRSEATEPLELFTRTTVGIWDKKGIKFGDPRGTLRKKNKEAEMNTEKQNKTRWDIIGILFLTFTTLQTINTEKQNKTRRDIIGILFLTFTTLAEPRLGHLGRWPGSAGWTRLGQYGAHEADCFYFFFLFF
jgi:hypothetical protein